MTSPVAAYTTTQDILQLLVGSPINFSGLFRGALAMKIPQVCADINRRVAVARGQGPGWSFLADSEHEVQLVSLAGAASAGTFTLSLGATTTAPIAFDADSTDVADALNAALGADSVTVDPAGDGGPWRVLFTGTGPQPLLVPISDLTPATTYVIAERLVPGTTVPSTRLYRGRGSVLLPIDDCVEVRAVRLVRADGTLIRAMAEGVDYIRVPLSYLPITALELVNGGLWPRHLFVEIDLVPGFAVEIPPDVQEAAGIEVIRSYLADRAGNDDRLGMDPFGRVMVSKAFTSKVNQLVSDYSYGATLLGRSG